MLHFNMGRGRAAPGHDVRDDLPERASRRGPRLLLEELPDRQGERGGANGRNTLDPQAPGAIGAWTRARRSRGRRTAAAPGPGDAGWAAEPASAPTRAIPPATRGHACPGSAGRRDRETPESNQPYYAYGEQGSYRLVSNARALQSTLTAGGYAPVGSFGVVTVTVRNLRTLAEGRTKYLGGGIALGPLSPPVPVAKGDSYSIGNSGTVLKAEGDVFLEKAFGLGNFGGRFPFVTEDNGVDRAEPLRCPTPSSSPSASVSQLLPLAPVSRILMVTQPADGGVFEHVSALAAGSSGIRPEGFEPSASASGGQRSIH